MSFGGVLRGLVVFFGAGELGLETRRAPPRLVVLKPLRRNSSIRSGVMYHLLPFPGSWDSLAIFWKAGLRDRLWRMEFCHPPSM